jgi:GTP-binding protein Era
VLAAVETQSQAKFLGSLVPLIPEGPQYYPEDELTDANLRFFAAEFVREQVIRQTREEVPHATMVEIFVYKELPDRHVIDANIHVETDGQKAIIIGRKGSLIKRIQARASERLSELTGIPAQIRCHVKVSPKWRDNKGFLSSMGMGGR